VHQAAGLLLPPDFFLLDHPEIVPENDFLIFSPKVSCDSEPLLLPTTFQTPPEPKNLFFLSLLPPFDS